MKINCKIEPADYLRANWLHQRPRRFFTIAAAVLGVLAAFTFCVTLYEFIAKGTNLQAPLAIGGGGVLLAYCFLVSFPRRVAKLYQQQKLLQQPFTVEVTQAGLETWHPNGQSKLPWEVFLKWKASRDMVLLYQCDLETSGGGHGFEYYNRMAATALQFIVDALDRERLRLV